MTEYIHLIGAEQVQNAASTMSHAAEQMKRAADNFNGAIDQQQRFMDDWLLQLATILEAAK